MKIIDVPQSILDLLALSEGAHAWPKPEKLLKPLLPVTKFDSAKLLPGVLREFCEDIAYRMQCPIDFVAVAAVSMLGSVIGAGCAVRPKQKDDWTEVPNLWGGVVARPGKLKSPAIFAGMKPFRALEADAEEVYQADLAEHRTQALTSKLSADLLKKKIARVKDEALLDSSPDLARLKELSRPPEDEPKLRRYKTNDSTVEKLGEFLAVNPRGMLVYRDELFGLLKSFEQQGHEGDRTFYLESWTGRYAFRVDRIGRGEIRIPHLCLAVFGGIQPTKLQEYLFEVQSGNNDGLLQRFQLLVYPDEIEDEKNIDEEPNREASEKLTAIVLLLANTDFGSVGATLDHHESIPHLRFESVKAQPLFFAWLNQLKGKIVDEQDSPLVQEHLAKFTKLVPCLALIFHLFECAKRKKLRIPAINARSLALAIAWAGYLEKHARRIYGMCLDLRVTAAATLARKIQANELADGFNERDVYRRGWANLSDPEYVHAACGELEAAGWIRRRQPKPGNGRPPSPIYDINPATSKNEI